MFILEFLDAMILVGVVIFVTYKFFIHVGIIKKEKPKKVYMYKFK